MGVADVILWMGGIRRLVETDQHPVLFEWHVVEHQKRTEVAKSMVSLLSRPPVLQISVVMLGLPAPLSISGSFMYLRVLCFSGVHKIMNFPKSLPFLGSLSRDTRF